MRDIATWALVHNIPATAMTDLLRLLGLAAPVPPPPGSGECEAAVQSAVRLEAARRGVTLWRNNTGMAFNENGSPIRFGLCNDSAAVNRVCKSSDLIGIGPDGRFHAYECKAPGWKYRESDQRARAQLAFIKLVQARGGVARFITNVGDL